MEEDQILEARLKGKDTQQTAKCNLIRVHDCAAWRLSESWSRRDFRGSACSTAERSVHVNLNMLIASVAAAGRDVSRDVPRSGASRQSTFTKVSPWVVGQGTCSLIKPKMIRLCALTLSLTGFDFERLARKQKAVKRERIKPKLVRRRIGCSWTAGLRPNKLLFEKIKNDAN